MKNIPILYQRKEDCCGCMACYAVCFKAAIFIVEDKEGFKYPLIDKNKCVGCFQCIKVCPLKKEEKCYEPSKCSVCVW